MSLLCKILGHKWTKTSNRYIRKCKRCSVEKHLMYSRYNGTGIFSSYTWHIINQKTKK